MKSTFRFACAWMLACLLGAAAYPAHAQDARKDPLNALDTMLGEWNVEQRTWDGPDAEPMRHPDSFARRRLIGAMFVQETMEGTAGRAKEPFKRVAYFNYNQVTQRYETVSMDTRGPQMMYEKSYQTTVARDGGTILVILEDDFVLPMFGGQRNVGFKGRKEVQIAPDRQIVRLYWTPLATPGAKEFLATEYVYTRKR